MACPPVRGDNPRTLASGLFYVQVDKHGITVLYNSVDLTHHYLFRAKIGKWWYELDSAMHTMFQFFSISV